MTAQDQPAGIPLNQFKLLKTDFYQRVKRRVLRSVTLPLHKMGFTLGSNDAKIKTLRNCHAGRRAFVIGNGPSLQIKDLDLLRNEITFCSNKIFLAFETTSWRPTYYFVADKLVAKNNAEIIKKLPLTKLISDQLREFMDYEDATMWMHERPIALDPSDRSIVRGRGRLHEFSEDILVGVYGGGTVIYHQLQVAFYMGITEVILLGLDFKFNVPQATATTDVRGYETALVASGEVNHFHPEYRKPGEVWGIPNLDAQRRAFSSALQHYRAAGRSITNASRQTACDVFPRCTLEEILSPAIPHPTRND